MTNDTNRTVTTRSRCTVLGHVGDAAMSGWYELCEVLPPEGVTVRVYNHTRGFMNDVMINGKFSHIVVRWRYI